MYKVVKVDSWLRQQICTDGKPSKYGKPKLFKTEKEAQKWINKAFNVSSASGPTIDFHTMFTSTKMNQVQVDNDADLDHLFDDGIGDDDDDDNTEINSLSDVFPDLKW